MRASTRKSKGEKHRQRVYHLFAVVAVFILLVRFLLHLFSLFFFKSVGLDTVVPVPSLYEISDEINSNAPNARQSANSSCGRVVERVANEETTKKETWETEPASLDSIVAPLRGNERVRPPSTRNGRMRRRIVRFFNQEGR